jgi:hypothetical protein
VTAVPAGMVAAAVARAPTAMAVTVVLAAAVVVAAMPISPAMRLPAVTVALEAAAALGPVAPVSAGLAAGNATTISGPGVLDAMSGAVLNGGVIFTGAGGQLVVSGAAPTTTISGFAKGDQIDLTGLTFSGTTSVSSFANGVLTVKEGGTTETLNLSNVASGTAFVLANDGHNGTDIIGAGAAATEIALNADIRDIDVGGNLAAANTSYVITVAANISLTSELLAVNLMSGSSLTIVGTNGAGGGVAQVQTINGEGDQRGFFIYSGNVTLENLTIQDAVAVGGAGISGGGGGAGLGGGLFVKGTSGGGVSVPHGVVTLDNVSFVSDAAKGGSATDVNGGKDGGGGGLGGAGGEGQPSFGGGGGGVGGRGEGPGSGTSAVAQAGIIPGAAGGGKGFGTGGIPGPSGGGGGHTIATGGSAPGGGGGVGGHTATAGRGGSGGFGGGGGGAPHRRRQHLRSGPRPDAEFLW